MSGMFLQNYIREPQICDLKRKKREDAGVLRGALWPSIPTDSNVYARPLESVTLTRSVVSSLGKGEKQVVARGNVVGVVEAMQPGMRTRRFLRADVLARENECNTNLEEEGNATSSASTVPRKQVPANLCFHALSAKERAGLHYVRQVQVGSITSSYHWSACTCCGRVPCYV